MDLDNVECVTPFDGMMDEDEIDRHPSLSHPHHHPLAHPFGTSKAHNNGSGANSNSSGHPATSVHELLECPVCTNSMYPPLALVTRVLLKVLIQIKEEMRNGEVALEKYIITKTLTKPPEAYPDAKNQPHVEVALRPKQSGYSSGCSAGDTVTYII